MQGNTRRRKMIKGIVAVVLLVAIHVKSLVVLLYTELDAVVAIFNSITDWILERPAGGLTLVVVCYIVGITILFPTTIFIFTIGIVCHSLLGVIGGFALGLALTFFCTVCGSTLSFLFARHVLKKPITAAIRPTWVKTRAVLKAIDTKGFKIVFLLRIAPIFPFSLLNYALGISNLKLSTYILASIGLLPKQFLYMYVAVSVGTLSEAIKNGENNNTEIIIVLVTGAVLGIIATIYVTLAAKKEMNKILAENHPILDQTEESLNT